MDGKMLARFGAVVFIALAITATAIDLARKDEPSSPHSVPVLQPPIDPLREGQRRCQQLGEAAANDADCLRIWAETRDRFLGRTPAQTAPDASEGR